MWLVCLGPPACGVFGPKKSSLEHAILIQDDQGTICLAMVLTQVTSLAALTATHIVIFWIV